MFPLPDNRRPYNSRLDNLISWFAASVMVTAGVIYVLKLQEDRGKPKPERVLARATPAQEPLTLHERRAAERGRGRRARAPPPETPDVVERLVALFGPPVDVPTIKG
jgi:hypothetical protein